MRCSTRALSKIECFEGQTCDFDDLAYLTFILLISWLFSIVLPDLISSINSLLKIDTTGIANFIKEVSDNKAIKELFDYFGNSSDITSTLSDYSQQILNQVLSVLTGVFASVSTICFNCF